MKSPEQRAQEPIGKAPAISDFKCRNRKHNNNNNNNNNTPRIKATQPHTSTPCTLPVHPPTTTIYGKQNKPHLSKPDPLSTPPPASCCWSNQLGISQDASTAARE
ncbi:uncharacterized protein CYBJADRAFT_70185 [Cyberlindnera jadinii NRRL Y-1542]|uniref:Uncharacterized protein n=1 Tax=Cyberlindnera jadinii (strain ATCC 18201 / CBS 1600 / BCRC 20928 / JCM 3617 / NBRC 0987 / NRRL Y-1542) TaxID=983966 RepID=A0A1E4S3T0_CYBJN|nr:hypothetical protein CYBJADRAFT_70185 [Cyberlindnera jadinii NRRL Y-1542]ODV74177.1 hypothetical protein CYBJADRAFT_70185 [Cyberlindnera jadinii NRRL Y-1542]